ncbi:MAG: c-type cytochrome [Nitrospinae bacterium]|nr:c-type cytochrome [Nitrospinota bacterium]
MDEIREHEIRQQEDPDEARSYGTVYLVVSLLLVLTAFWVIWDESFTRRPWKMYQRTFNKMEFEMTQAQLEKAKAKLASYANTPIPDLKDPEGKPVQITHNELMKRLAAAEARLKSAEYQAAVQEAKRLENRMKFGVEQEIQFAKSLEEEAYYEYKEAKKAARSYKNLEKEVEALAAERASYMPERDRLAKELLAAEEKVKAISKEAEYYRKLRDAAYSEIDELERMLDSIKKRWPQVMQVVLSDYTRDNFRNPTLRVDRCNTCHLGIDKVGFEKAPQPYTTHPQRELFLEKHPINKFGCTFCHKGQDSATDSVENAHGSHHDMDQTPTQNEPLLQGAEIQSSCRKCHNEEVNLEGAPVLSKGRRLFEEVGCFGCHTTRGYEDFAKVGPDLTKIATKTSPSWAFRWVKNPRSYLPRTRMPNFFLKDNEAEAIVAYLWDSSQNEGAPPVDLGFQEGNIPPELAARGKEIVEKVGCLGCHSMGDKVVQVSEDLARDFGPNLTRVAGKVNAQWLYRWIKDPKEYFPKTRMPNLRLSDEEAKAVVAYLMSLAPKSEIPGIEKKIKDSMQIVEGERLIANYGCYGCHEIKGMEKRSKIGVELTTYGEKRVLELEFGYATHVKETWSDWTFAKLKDPRQFQTERVIQRMPNFSFTDEEALALRTLLQSFTGEALGVPAKYARQYTEEDLNREKGRRLVRERNCVGCHLIEGKGGKIAKFYENLTFAPPNLASEGEKVQSTWLFTFLKRPIPIRPWLQVRMPTFGFSDEDTHMVINYFMAADKAKTRYTFVEDERILPENLQAAQVMIGKQYLDCFNCHQQGDQKPEGPPEGWAPDLGMARMRLNPFWIVKWLQDPQKIMPGTKMPTFFSDAESGPPDVLNGDEQKQMEALRDYIMMLGKEKGA